METLDHKGEILRKILRQGFTDILSLFFKERFLSEHSWNINIENSRISDLKYAEEIVLICDNIDKLLHMPDRVSKRRILRGNKCQQRKAMYRNAERERERY